MELRQQILFECDNDTLSKFLGEEWFQADLEAYRRLLEKFLVASKSHRVTGCLHPDTLGDIAEDSEADPPRTIAFGRLSAVSSTGTAVPIVKSNILCFTTPQTTPTTSTYDTLVEKLLYVDSIRVRMNGNHLAGGLSARD